MYHKHFPLLGAPTVLKCHRRALALRVLLHDHRMSNYLVAHPLTRDRSIHTHVRLSPFSMRNVGDLMLLDLDDVKIHSRALRPYGGDSSLHCDGP